MFSRCPVSVPPASPHALDFFVPRKAQASPLQRALPGRHHLYKARLPFPKSIATETQPFQRNMSSSTVWRRSVSALRGVGKGRVGHFPSPLTNCSFLSAAHVRARTYPEQAAERLGESHQPRQYFQGFQVSAQFTMAVGTRHTATTCCSSLTRIAWSLQGWRHFA